MIRHTDATKSHSHAVLQALLVTFLWSTSWVLIKFTLRAIPPLTFAGLRYMIAAILLLPGFWKHRNEVHTLSRKHWLQLALLGLVFYTLTQGGQFLTLQYLPATTFSLILNFTTLAVAILGFIFLKESPSRIQWLGIGIFLLGVCLYFYRSSHPVDQPLGFILAGITLAANAVASLMGRSINRQEKTHPLVVTTISMGIGAFVLLSLGLAVEPFPALTLQNIAVILWLAVVNTAFAFVLWNQSLRVLSAAESSIINNAMLVQIAILAWIFLDEKLGMLEIVGLLMATAGIILANRKSRAIDVSEGNTGYSTE